MLMREKESEKRGSWDKRRMHYEWDERGRKKNGKMEQVMK